VHGFGPAGSSVTVSGADSGNGVFMCLPETEGFLGAQPTTLKFLVTGAAKNVTFTSTIGPLLPTFVQVDANGSASHPNNYSFAGPRFATTTAAQVQYGDTITLDLWEQRELHNPDHMTFYYQYYVLQTSIDSSYTIASIDIGTHMMAVAINAKRGPNPATYDPQCGITFIVNGVYVAAVDPAANSAAAGYEIKPGVNWIAGYLKLSTGEIRISSNSGPVVGMMGVSMPPVGQLRYERKGCFQFPGAIFAQNLKGFEQVRAIYPAYTPTDADIRSLRPNNLF
jgi:hypothetical protein